MREKGQAIVEMALITPILLLLLLGIADVGSMALRANVAQGAAQTVAGLEALDAPRYRVTDALERAGCATGKLVVLRVDPEVRVTLRCPYVSLTSILPSVIEVQATSVAAPSPSEAP